LQNVNLLQDLKIQQNVQMQDGKIKWLPIDGTDRQEDRRDSTTERANRDVNLQNVKFTVVKIPQNVKIRTLNCNM